MKDIHKSALWALISIPITMFGISVSFAIAHGSVPFMILFLGPGLLVLWLIGDGNYPTWLLGSVGFTAQYFSYFLIIHGISKLIHIYKKRNETNTTNRPPFL